MPRKAKPLPLFEQGPRQAELGLGVRVESKRYRRRISVLMGELRRSMENKDAAK